MKRVFLRFACILLLLFAQQAALTHAAWHATHETPPLQHDGKGKASFQGSLCDLHVTFNQVLGGVHTCSLPPAVSERFVEDPERNRYSHCVEVSLPFFSRAPPLPR